MKQLFLFSLLFIMTHLSVSATDMPPVPFAIGYLEEDEEIADRDNEIPSLYDRNKWELMRQRDRWLLRHGKCCPPPGVLVSPSITMPAPKDGRFYKYDPRNSRYRSAR